MVRRPQRLETVVRSRAPPCLKFQTSTTLCWPHSPQLQVVPKTVRPLQTSTFAPWEEADSITGLYANVLRPTGVTEQSKLPVVVVSPCIIQNDVLISSTWRFPVDLRWSVFHR
jgi:hypothetical protein